MDNSRLNDFLKIDKESVVMIVDDDELTCEAIEDLLGDAYTVVSVRSGDECLASVHERCPDLILLDIQMPVMDGYEVFDRLKANAPLDIPVIFLTAEHDAKIHAECLASGAVDYIEKPAHPLILRQRVEKALIFDAALKYLMNELETKQAEIAHRDRKVKDLSNRVAHLTETQMTLLRSQR